MNSVETEVVSLYRKLWPEIQSIRTPAIISQFLYNVDLPRDWFKNKLCLDVGCGSGFAVWTIQQLDGTCYACDLDYTSLQRFKKSLNAEGNSSQLINASALQLPYASGSFDFVHSNGVLHHTRNPRQGFAELVRVTRSGGVVFIGMYGNGGLYNAALQIGRVTARFIPYSWTDTAITPILQGRRVPGSFMPAKISVLDNLYVPIRHSYREIELRQWFLDESFKVNDVLRTKTSIYDHHKVINRFIHGGGYIQLRGNKPEE